SLCGPASAGRVLLPYTTPFRSGTWLRRSAASRPRSTAYSTRPRTSGPTSLTTSSGSAHSNAPGGLCRRSVSLPVWRAPRLALSRCSHADCGPHRLRAVGATSSWPGSARWRERVSDIRSEPRHRVRQPVLSQLPQSLLRRRDRDPQLLGEGYHGRHPLARRVLAAADSRGEDRVSLPPARHVGRGVDHAVDAMDAVGPAREVNALYAVHALHAGSMVQVTDGPRGRATGPGDGHRSR